jgi:hypothetical protein
MRKPPLHVWAGVIGPWAIVTLIVTMARPDKIPDAVIGAAICTTITVAVIGNRRYFHRDINPIQSKVNTLLTASKVGKYLDEAGAPFEGGEPDPVIVSHHLNIDGQDVIVGVCDGVDPDVAGIRAALRRAGA